MVGTVLKLDTEEQVEITALSKRKPLGHHVVKLV